MHKIILWIILITSCGIQVSAQQRQWNIPMQLKSCSIDIKADHFTATTFIEMEFYNPNNQEIEGLYTFQLRPGQVITAFQLDLHGKYREGTIEEKWKATNAYNTIVGKRIDPALLTMDYADHYRLNIYPVPAKSSRKVTMTIQQLLSREKRGLLYVLPLNIQDTVRQFGLNITVSGNTMPATLAGLIANLAFEGGRMQHHLSWSREDIKLNNPIAFSIPLSSNTFSCSKKLEQKIHFALHLQPACPAEYEIHPKKLKVFWDASGSLANRDVKKEIGFLKQFISFHKVEKITIILFNHKLLDTAIFYTGSDPGITWQQYLQNIQYAGATQLGCVDLSGFGSDMLLLFTDGNNTYGRSRPKTGTGLLYCVYSSNAANVEMLRQLTGASGGKVIDLNKETISNAVTINSKAENWLLNISSAGGKTIIEQSIPLKINQPLLINGTMNSESDTLYFYYGNNNLVNYTEKLILSSETQCNSLAVDRIFMLSNFDKMIRSGQWQDILDFGLREKIVTPNTAFIVLERIEDYIKYNIAAPKDLQAECERINYVKKDTRPKRTKLNEADEFELLRGVVKAYNERINRWDANESSISFSRPDVDKQLKSIVTIAEPKETIREETRQMITGVADKVNAMQEVVVTAYGTSMKKDMTGSVATISSQQLGQSYGTVEQTLQGRVAGLSVTNSNASAGSSGYINIRGARSMTGNNEPLYVLDGIPVSGDINNFININDIENINILRDSQAGALYGSRAANGAIVITSKKGKNYYRNNNNKPYRLKDMEDVEYLQEIKGTVYSEKKNVYQALRQQNENDPGFYFDMAQHFFETGLKVDAMEILMNAAEVSNGSYQVLRAIGYVLESWKQFDEAARVYEQLLNDYPGNLYSHRDLAWAFYQDGKYQEAVDVLYNAIKNDLQQQEGWSSSLKAMLLAELNAIIAMHKDRLNLSAIPSVLIKPMPVDLRIVLDCNKGNLGYMSIKEPGGATSSFAKPVTRNGGTLNMGPSGYYYGGPAEYQIKNAITGKYRVILNYYDYYSYPGKVPAMVRMVTFNNFGKATQSIHVENMIMDNQYGEIEIGEIRR